MPLIEFCRNCRNLVERRDIEGFTACIRNHRPGIACEDFRAKPDAPESVKRGLTFCLYCENLAIGGGFAACARNHRPRIACEDFVDAVKNTRKTASMRRLMVAYLLTSPRWRTCAAMLGEYSTWI